MSDSLTMGKQLMITYNKLITVTTWPSTRWRCTVMSITLDLQPKLTNLNLMVGKNELT